MQTKTEFVAQNSDEAAVARKIGADKVIYQTLAALKKAVQQENPKIKNFCAACFDGIYPTGDITPDLLEDIEADRRAAQDAQLELNL
jgi:amidophosphoribosyltransferase